MLGLQSDSNILISDSKIRKIKNIGMQCRIYTLYIDHIICNIIVMHFAE